MLHVMLIVTMTISITGIIVIGIGHSGVVVSMHVCICKVCPLFFIGQYIEYTYTLHTGNFRGIDYTDFSKHALKSYVFSFSVPNKVSSDFYLQVPRLRLV